MAVTDPGASYEDAGDRSFPFLQYPQRLGTIESVDLGPLRSRIKTRRSCTRVMGASLLLRIHPLRSRCESSFSLVALAIVFAVLGSTPAEVGQGALDAAKGSVGSHRTVGYMPSSWG